MNADNLILLHGKCRLANDNKHFIYLLSASTHVKADDRKP